MVAPQEDHHNHGRQTPTIHFICRKGLNDKQEQILRLKKSHFYNGYIVSYKF